MKFTDRNGNFWKWWVYSAELAFIFSVLWSIYHMVPGLFPVALAMSFAAAVTGLVFTVFMTVKATKLRYRAWWCWSLVTIGLALNLVMHASVGRRYEVAKIARESRYIEEERDQQRRQAEHKRQQESQEKAAQLLQQQQDLLEAQRRLSLTVPRSRRGSVQFFPISPVDQMIPQPLPVPTAIITAGIQNKDKDDGAMLTPEQEQQRSWWAVLLGIIAEVSLIAGCSTAFVRALIEDTDNNGIADWKQQIPPADLLREYPEDYEKLYGPLPSQSSFRNPVGFGSGAAVLPGKSGPLSKS